MPNDNKDSTASAGGGGGGAAAPAAAPAANRGTKRPLEELKAEFDEYDAEFATFLGERPLDIDAISKACDRRARMKAEIQQWDAEENGNSADHSDSDEEDEEDEDDEAANEGQPRQDHSDYDEEDEEDEDDEAANEGQPRQGPEYVTQAQMDAGHRAATLVADALPAMSTMSAKIQQALAAKFLAALVAKMPYPGSPTVCPYLNSKNYDGVQIRAECNAWSWANFGMSWAAMQARPTVDDRDQSTASPAFVTAKIEGKDGGPATSRMIGFDARNPLFNRGMCPRWLILLERGILVAELLASESVMEFKRGHQSTDLLFMLPPMNLYSIGGEEACIEEAIADEFGMLRYFLAMKKTSCSILLLNVDETVSVYGTFKLAPNNTVVVVQELKQAAGTVEY